MQESNFIDKLNVLRSLTGRFKLLHNSYSVVLDGSDVEVFHLADYKVLFTCQNYSSMNKEYNPFMQGNVFLSEEEKKFIEQYRIGHIEEPLIEAFYCDVFCNAQDKRNSKYADILIDNYLKVVSNYKEYKPADVLWVMKSLMFNCKKNSKQGKKQIFNAIDLFLTSDILLKFKYQLLVNAYKFKFLKAQEVMSYASNYNLIDSISESYFDNQRFFTMLLDCTPPNDITKVRAINQKLANNEDIIISQSPLDCSMLSFLLKKHQYLELAGLSDEAEKVYKQYLSAKTRGKGIIKVEMSFEIPNISQYYINTIITSPFPILTLAEDDSLLPQIDDCQSNILSELQKIGTRLSYVDINGNPHSGECFYRNKLFKVPYHCLYNYKTIYPIVGSLKNLIEQGSFSEGEILRYLSSTWLNIPRLAVNSDIRKSHESWIDSLHPSIHSLCYEITSEILSEGNYHGDYMNAIDSLVMKIEGCLREACRRLGISTVKPKSNDEDTLDKILQKIEAYQNEHNTSIISAASLNLLENIFTKKGLNLRNNIAHGFTSLYDYNIYTALTVFHCLLKVTTMKVPEKICEE